MTDDKNLSEMEVTVIAMMAADIKKIAKENKVLIEIDEQLLARCADWVGTVLNENEYVMEAYWDAIAEFIADDAQEVEDRG